MLANMRFFKWLFGCFVLVLTLGFVTARAQDSDTYREEYDRAQKIAKTTQPAKQADELLTFMKERSKMDPKILDYATKLFIADLQRIKGQADFASLKDLCERAIKMNPLFGEAYLYYGFALKSDKKYPEAMNAFAKAYLIRTASSLQAKEQLDATYRSAHRGSLVGEDKIIEDAHKELKKVQ
jgi:tetratricopeptide (TPR) repeat protein